MYRIRSSCTRKHTLARAAHHNALGLGSVPCQIANTRLRAYASGRSASRNGEFAHKVTSTKTDLIFQVFGANTGVGKTVVSAGLCRAACDRGIPASYIKPVQTGLEKDEDAVRILCNGVSSSSKNSMRSALRASTLFSYSKPVSPHLAAAHEGKTTTDHEVLRALVKNIEAETAISKNGDSGKSTNAGSFCLVETAGGVLSPSPSGTLQADLLRPLRLPALLVGDPNLGGISTTLSALESLRVRGFSVMGIVVIGGGNGGLEGAISNAEAVEREVKEAGIPVYRVGKELPPSDVPLNTWMDDACSDFSALLDGLQGWHRSEMAEKLSLRQRATSRLWWPFTQHSGMKQEDILVVDSAYGDYYHVLKTGATAADAERSSTMKEAALEETIATVPLFDGPASWWTQGMGHGNPNLTMSSAYASGRYGHVIMAGVAHEPAVQLAEELIDKGPGAKWATKVFYSDNGSTAVEVALKMALRRYMLDCWPSTGGIPHDPNESIHVIAQSNCYHGDTLGVMNVSPPSVFNIRQHPWYKPHGMFLDPPTLAWRHGEYKLQIPPTTLKGMIKSCGVGVSHLPDHVTHFKGGRKAAFDWERRESDKFGSELSSAYTAQISSAIDEYEQQTKIHKLEEKYLEGEKIHKSHRMCRLGALIIEPVVIGAGGMLLVDPVWQRALIMEAKRRNIPVIYDEVFCGLGRLGYTSASDILGVMPDIACYAKLLTGGLMPLAVTLASERIFDAFRGEKAETALLHGHSYTAHPIGCSAALHAVRELRTAITQSSLSSQTSTLTVLQHHEPGSCRYWDDESAVKQLSMLPGVERCFSFGTVFAVELKGSGSYGVKGGRVEKALAALRSQGVMIRPLGGVLYCMVTPFTPKSECDRLLEIFLDVLGQKRIAG